jgi:starch phosphorylase
VDVLNTPQPPQEASGTSGMKAALNGVSSLSILDGWWIEGCIEGKTGWAIDPGPVDNDRRDFPRRCGVVRYARQGDHPALHQQPPRLYRRDVTQPIALNGSFFNTQRTVLEYPLKAYFR